MKIYLKNYYKIYLYDNHRFLYKNTVKYSKIGKCKFYKNAKHFSYINN